MKNRIILLGLLLSVTSIMCYNKQLLNKSTTLEITIQEENITYEDTISLNIEILNRNNHNVGLSLAAFSIHSVLNIDFIFDNLYFVSIEKKSVIIEANEVKAVKMKFVKIDDIQLSKEGIYRVGCRAYDDRSNTTIKYFLQSKDSLIITSQ